MAMESSHGHQVVYTKEIIKKIKRKDSERFTGMIIVFIKDTGIMAFKMD